MKSPKNPLLSKKPKAAKSSKIADTSAGPGRAADQTLPKIPGDSLIEEMVAGKRLALARIISKVEGRDPSVRPLLESIYSMTGRAQIWGITGPPGAGKSTLVDRVTAKLRKLGKRVGIVCVDPSSPFSGGAILGDRIRMQSHVGDAGVFIRSLGTRGQHGGLSHSAKEVVMVLDAAGFDVVLVETAGVGQTELEIMKLAQSTLVVLVPESGDGIQVMKAGLMEIADVFAVNKSDRPQADQLVRELTTMVSMGEGHADSTVWMPPVLKTEAHRDHGIEELVKVMLQHQEFLTQSGARETKARTFLKSEVLDILSERLGESVAIAFGSQSGNEILDQLLRREIDPYSAADLLSGTSNT